MSDTIDRIMEVTKFADLKGDLNTGYQTVQFRKNEVRACNYDGGAAAVLDLDITAVVSAQRLLKVCKALPNAEVSLVDGEAKGSRQRLLLQQGDAKARLEVLDPKAGVSMGRPTKKAAWHEVHGLNEVDRVAWSACKDTQRRHLTGIHLGKFGMAATNGQSAATLSTPGDLTKELGTAGILVPVDMLKGLPEVNQISLDGNRLYIAEDPSAGGYRVVNLIEAQFPPLEQVLSPVWSMDQMEIPRQPLEDMLKRAKLADPNLILSVEKKRLQVVVDSKRPAAGTMSLFDFEDSVPFKGKVKSGYIGFANNLVLPAVQACESDNISIFIRPDPGGSIEPMGIVDGAYKVVIMPLRV